MGSRICSQPCGASLPPSAHSDGNYWWSHLQEDVRKKKTLHLDAVFTLEAKIRGFHVICIHKTLYRDRHSGYFLHHSCRSSGHYIKQEHRLGTFCLHWTDSCSGNSLIFQPAKGTYCESTPSYMCLSDGVAAYLRKCSMLMERSGKQLQVHDITRHWGPTNALQGTSETSNIISAV